MSARCCHLFKEDWEIRDEGKDMTATAFEDRIMHFKDLMKERMSHSCIEI